MIRDIRSISNLRPVLFLLAVIDLVAPIAATSSQDLPEPLTRVGFDQRLGETVPLELTFHDEQGQAVVLEDLFGERPVVLALVYYKCPMLCTMVLNGVTSSLRDLDFDPGEEFEVLVVSFDASDTAEDARKTRRTHLERYDRPGTESGWHFLTGDQQSIDRLTASVGFKFTAIEDSTDFAHAAGIVTLTPDGQVARYHYGVEYPPRNVRLGLVEAADNRIGGVVDQVLLYCFHYDPVTGQYSATAMNIVRLGAAVTIVLVALFLFLQWHREKRQRPAAMEV